MLSQEAGFCSPFCGAAKEHLVGFGGYYLASDIFYQQKLKKEGA